MTTTSLFTRLHGRIALVIGLTIVLLLAGTGVATARWLIAATATAPVTSGTLTAELDGSELLSVSNVASDDYSPPVELTLRNSNPIAVNHTLTFAPESGTLAPAEVGIAVWEPTGVGCVGPVPATAQQGTLEGPPILEIPDVPAQSSTSVCAATKFTGPAIFGSADKTLTVTPTLTAGLPTGSWETSDYGKFTLTMAPAPGPVTGVQCDNKNSFLGINPRGVTLSWSPVTDAEKYLITSSTGQTVEVYASSVDLTTDNAGKAEWIDIAALGPTGGSTTERQPLRIGYLLLGAPLRCPPFS